MLRGPFRLLVPASLGIACSASPPPPAPTPPGPRAPAPVTTAAPLPPARWTTTGGATLVGPAVAGGTLVLVGGRRALVASDGTVKGETSPLPEPVVEIVQVPRASGGVAVVGRGARVLYRLDDPLGAPVVLARSEVDVSSIGAGPGLVAVWDRQSDLPRMIDVDTGKDASLSLPDLPLRALAFASPKEGAGVFQAVGLAVTADGGGTWKPVSEAHAGDALRVTGVRTRGGGVRAFQYAEGREAPVHVSKAQLGALDEPAAETGDAPLLRWIRTTGRDPLEAAVSDGVLSPRGGAVVASHGLVARVDLGTGMLLEVQEFARGPGLDRCRGVHQGDAAWFACALAEGTQGDLYDPFGVLKVALGASPLAVDKPALMRNGSAELRASPSGGLMLTAACSADEEANACVRQPDGTWASIHVELDPVERGFGPLADGRFAAVRGLWRGDEGDGGQNEAAQGSSGDAHPLTFVVIDTTGRERSVGPPIGVVGELRVMSPVQEADDGTLTAVVVSEESGPMVLSQKPGREASTPVRVEAADEVRLDGAHGIAVAKDGIRLTLDAGATWTDAGATGELLEAVRGAPIEEPDAIAVSEVGTRLDTALRIGWGAAEPPVPPRESSPLVRLAPRTSSPAPPPRTLSCTSDGAAQSSPPLLGTNQVRAALGTKTPPPKGTRRESSTAPSVGALGMLGTIAVLEEEGPDKTGSSPAKWTIRWQSGSELGAKTRTWSGPPPKGAAWGAALRSASSDGGRAVFAVRVGGKFVLLRVSGGASEMIDAQFELLPSTDAAFGRGKGEPIAWMRDTALVTWRTGEPPRVAGAIGSHASRTLGIPAPDGVPVHVSGSDWALVRTFPLPQAAKKGDKPAVDVPAPSLAGWTKTPNLRKVGAALPACEKDGKGARFTVTRSALEIGVDGHEGSAVTASYEVSVDGDKACVVSMAALVQPRARASAPAPAKKQASGPVSWVRSDFVGKRAEGGDRGLSPGGNSRRLSCKLEPR